MNKLFLTVLTALGFATGCQAADEYTNLDTRQFADSIRQPDVQLLDVRHTEEFDAGHLDGASHIDVLAPGFMDKAEAALDKTQPVAVYCRSGRRSAEAAEELAARGYHVVNMAGGILAWQKAGLPVVK